MFRCLDIQMIQALENKPIALERFEILKALNIWTFIYKEYIVASI